MKQIEYHKIISNLLLDNKANIKITFDFIELDFSENVLNVSNDLKIENEVIQDRIRLLKKSIKTKVYSSIDSFLNECNIENNSNILIIDNEDVISFFEDETYVNFKLRPDNYLIKNQKSFLEFKIFLKEQECERDGVFHFVDSYNTVSKKIILVSISENGRLTISYDNKAPNFDLNINYNIGFEKFKNCFNENNKALIRFLKTSTIKKVSTFSNLEKMKMFFINLESIVENAKINFDVYLNELSIDKIKKDYDDLKSKYFNELSDILNKITNNIILLPIGIAAILFSIDKIKGMPIYLYLIIISIAITSLFLSYLLSLHLNDLSYLDYIFNYDYDLLVENKFFNKHQEELDFFENIKERVLTRINYLIKIIDSYYWILNISNVCVIDLILYHLNYNANFIVIFSLIIMTLIAYFRNILLKNSKLADSYK